MKSLWKFAATAMFGIWVLSGNPQIVSAAMVEWSWTYSTEESTPTILTSSSSFDVNIKITNDDISDSAIHLGPYSISEGYYYEGFYKFQSNIDEVVDTIIQPGKTTYLNIGTWTPVIDGPAPYVNIAVQPQYLEIYYLDANGDKLISGKEPLALMELTISDAINPDPYDPDNPDQGIIIYSDDMSYPDYTLPPFKALVPIPSSILLLGIGNCLLILVYRKRFR